MTNFLIELKKQTSSYEIKWRKLYDELHSSFIFKENHVFIEKEQTPSEKVVIVEEEIDCIGNLEDLPRLVFIDKEWWRSNQNISNKRSQTFYKPVDVHFGTNNMGKIVTSISMWNMVNQLSKHDFSGGQIFLVGGQ